MARDIQFSDNAETLLTTAINNTDDPVTFSVTAGDGAKFPSVTGDQFFYIVIVDVSGNYEKMEVTARSTDSFTATRGVGGTTLINFAVGDAVYLGFTEETFEEILFTQEAQEGTPHWCGAAGGTVDAITLTADPTITSYIAGQLFTSRS